MRKKHRRFLRNVTTIPGEYQYALLLVAHIDKKKTIKVVRKSFFIYLNLILNVMLGCVYYVCV